MSQQTSNRQVTIAVVVVVVLALTSFVGGLAWTIYGSLGDNLVYYWSPTELVQKSASAQGQTVRLGGLVEAGSFDLEKCNPGCQFIVTDGTNRVAVSSTGLPPQMFREGIGVVVEGELQGDVFHTERIMVKHSNEYRAPKDGEKPDMASTLTEE